MEGRETDEENQHCDACITDIEYETRILEDIIHEKFKLKKPIAILINRIGENKPFYYSVEHFHEGEFYLLNGQAEETIEKAIEDFSDFLVDYLEMYSKEEDKLGPGPLKQYNHLKEILEKRL